MLEFSSLRKVTSQGLRDLPTHETRLFPAGSQTRLSELRGFIIIIIINIITTIIGINMLTIVNCEHRYWLNSTNESSALNVDFKQGNVCLDLTIWILRIYKLIVGLIL